MACLAVVLDGPKAKNGRKVFDSFVTENQQSFWNRELVQATEAMVYMGFMRPGTLFISAAPCHMKVLKDAWARRILKPAVGYTITSLGDLGAIQQVEQMHFVPLGDVLCNAIAQLNRSGQPATEQSIRQYVARHCAHVAPPAADMVHQTVTSLLATGLIYRMGEHFFVSVPTNSPPKVKATVECQTGMSIMAPPSHQEKEKRKGLLARLFSRGVRPSTNMIPPTLPAVPRISFSPADCLATLQPHQHKPAMALPPKNKFPTYNDDLARQAERKERRRRRETKLLSSSSECLNYGPIDPPECLPGRLEVVDDLTKRKRRAPRKQQQKKHVGIVRTSTPIDSDSAYSRSPVTTDSAEDQGSQSDPEAQKADHTYMNLIQRFDSTQFEDLTCSNPSEPPSLAYQMAGIHISNL